MPVSLCDNEEASDRTSKSIHKLLPSDGQIRLLRLPSRQFARNSYGRLRNASWPLPTRRPNRRHYPFFEICHVFVVGLGNDLDWDRSVSERRFLRKSHRGSKCIRAAIPSKPLYQRGPTLTSVSERRFLPSHSHDDERPVNERRFLASHSYDGPRYRRVYPSGVPSRAHSVSERRFLPSHSVFAELRTIKLSVSERRFLPSHSMELTYPHVIRNSVSERRFLPSHSLRTIVMSSRSSVSERRFLPSRFARSRGDCIRAAIPSKPQPWHRDQRHECIRAAIPSKPQLVAASQFECRAAIPLRAERCLPSGTQDRTKSATTLSQTLALQVYPSGVSFQATTRVSPSWLLCIRAGPTTQFGVV